MTSLERTVTWTGSRRDIERRLESDLKHRERFWEEVGRGASLRKLVHSHGFAAVQLWAVDRRVEAVEEERIATWYQRWWYRLRLLASGHSFELPLIGSGRTQRIAAHSEPVTANSWNAHLIGAINVRDQVSIDNLIAAWEEFEGPDYLRNRLEAWKALAVRDFESAARWMNLMSESLLAVPDDRAVSQPKRLQYLNECSFVEAISARSQAKFDNAIISAHNDHVSRYARDMGSPGVVRSPVATALVDLGRSAGLAYLGQSPYIIDLEPLLARLGPIAPEYENPVV